MRRIRQDQGIGGAKDRGTTALGNVIATIDGIMKNYQAG
ncbi:hypothetical protein D1AOALGA4SA_2497 [Olavius algarvensis Delta 1 endosymbiont]|nr:hypothetical protein D1AOALGA4SA_2497 [Olavius algarvensis Delta 1 endosymbiont]